MARGLLENEYLKCTVLPDIGVTYIPASTRSAASRCSMPTLPSEGADWVSRSVGRIRVEYNFLSPITGFRCPGGLCLCAHEDGSASVWVGNIDRVYGMQWEVELVLKPASTLLEERVTLYNRSDVRHRYYWWDNAAYRSGTIPASTTPCGLPLHMASRMCITGRSIRREGPESD